MYDIIIVGAGPAGLTAAIYARRAMKKVLVLEALNYGGQIINTLEIENYPVTPHISGFDFATKLYNQVKELGTEIKFEKVIELKDNKEIKDVITTKNIYKARSVILATGSVNRKLGLSNEDKLIGHGVSYCATCDGAFFKSREVAVVGGGNTAIQDALYLTNICKKVYLIHRKEELTGEEINISLLKEKSNFEFINNSNVTKLNGTDKLESIEVTSNNNKRTIPVEGIFVAIGRIPATENFKNLINVDSNGYIDSNEMCNTNVDGIFVAGDNRKKSLRQLVTATSDGAISASEAIKYINSLKK